MTQDTMHSPGQQGQASHDVHSVAEHGHGHGAGCGHEAMQHGDHTDYLHDGHRHAEHQGHWDEHGDTASSSGGSSRD